MPVGIYERTKSGWNKGKKCPQISKALLGKKLSPEHIAKLRDAKLKNPTRYWLGKKRPSLSLETKKKMSETHKRIGTKPPVRRGDDNNKWKGGISRAYKTGYYSTEYKIWRKSVFERDGYTCQICRKVGGCLNAHHIKGFAKYKELRFELTNGVTLCGECHKLKHKKEGY